MERELEMWISVIMWRDPRVWMQKSAVAAPKKATDGDTRGGVCV